MVCHRADLHAQVRQHGVRTPAAENAGGVRVNASAQERGGTARAQALHSEEEGVHAGVRLDVASTVAQGIGDMDVFDGTPRAKAVVVAFAGQR